MDNLLLDSAENIALMLLDQRDIASLRASCRFWRDVYKKNRLWESLIARRFGPQCAPADPSLAEITFKRLAKAHKPVQDSSVTWLDGNYLEVVNAAGSASDQVVRLNHVCWLHLFTAFPGVLPGRYIAKCRIKFLPQFFTDELNITATPDEGCGEAVTQTFTRAQLQHAAGQLGSAWTEIATGVVTVTELCAVEVKVHATSGIWKQGFLFDQLRLVRVEGGPGGMRAWQQQARPQGEEDDARMRWDDESSDGQGARRHMCCIQ